MDPRIQFRDANYGLQIGVNNGPINAQFNPLRVHGAVFGSYADQHHDECLPGTRVDILRQISEWASSPQGPCIFLLNGMAGTGKSTISRTVARSLNKTGSLGASFFFKRGEADRGNAMNLFPTIARQLAFHFPRLLPILQGTVHQNPGISAKSLTEQFDKLLLHPLLALNQLGHRSQPVVIVIDALDECDIESDMRIILQLLPQLQRSKSLLLRVFLTSRPELPIHQELLNTSTRAPVSDRKDLALHQLPRTVIEHDISLFLNHRLLSIKSKRSLPAGWPEPGVIQSLVELSVPLFIFAATVCRMLEDPYWDPIDSLAEILANENNGSQFDGTYLPILKRAVKETRNTSQLIQEFREIVGAIVMLESPLSVYSLSKLLGVSDGLIERRLVSLHSVISKPSDTTKPVRLFHKSFRDYLLDQDTRGKTPLWLETEEIHQKLTTRCLYLCESLKKNICKLKGATRRALIRRETIDREISPELQYSCRYWSHHLSQTKDPTAETDNILAFLQKHFLHWMEAMSILGYISEVVDTIYQLQLILPIDKNIELSVFLHDARRFVLKNRQIAEDVPLQIYCSGLAFAPTTSIIGMGCKGELPNWVYVLSNAQMIWNTELQSLEGHSGPVNSLKFSPDGRLLASASDDKTIRLWDVKTGALQRTLEDHPGPVESLAFSPDGELIASAASNNVQLWDVPTGAKKQSLTGHLGWVNSLVVSPENRTLTSVSNVLVKQQTLNNPRRIKSVPICPPVSPSTRFSQTLRDRQETKHRRKKELYKMKLQLERKRNHQSTEGLRRRRHIDFLRIDEELCIIHEEICIIEKELDIIEKELRIIKKQHDKKKVEILDMELAKEDPLPDPGKLGCISAVFSPDDRLLASVPFLGNTIELSNTTTGVRRRIFPGDASLVTSLAFSPNSRLLGAASDKIVQVWDTETCSLKQTSEITQILGSVIFSPDSRLLAFASYNAIRLYDMATGAVQILRGHSRPVTILVFSPNNRLLASASEDKSVHVWDVDTGILKQSLGANLYQLNALIFSPDSQLLASASADKTIRLWDMTMTDLYVRDDHSGPVESIALSSDGQILACASDDEIIRLYDARTGTLQQILEGHSRLMKSLAFSPDCQLLASASHDNTIKLWDMTTGTLRYTLKDGSVIVDSVTFIDDGLILKSISNSSRFNTVQLWDVATGEVVSAPRSDIDVDSDMTTVANIIRVEDQWVTIRGEKAIWLPPDYRLCPSAAKGNILALGHASGQFTILQFRI